MSDSNHPLRDIFNAAVEITDARQRANYLAQVCGANTALRQSLEELLAADADAGRFLSGVEGTGPLHAQNGPLVAGPPGTISEKPGDKIGRYKLLQQIGEGGCGVVYMAEQQEPLRRRVALKVIKLGMDTKSVIARFEAERQALALMDHPNIAKVFDAGATDAGRPYFVMELVRGVRITEYCDQHNLTTTARLELFTQVCQAIQHAHEKGIIHRDIKPSNILVTLHDGVPVPKVIDFGIAKATTDQRLTDKTLFTAFEQFMGTPAYMSPEQAEMSGLDIDRRSDVYALGVLLYELLTGKTPFDAKELLVAGIDEIRRIIREKEPLRPSTRLNTMIEADRTEIAKHRQTESTKLTTALRGDLDWIVMKALEKDRTRRYDTTGSLAQDIKRYLAEEPVSAGPPSPGYRFGKFVRRNKIALTVGAVSSLFAVAAIVSTFLLFREFAVTKYASIAVNSNPEGAEVWHGGQMVGITPFKVAQLPPGQFTYSLVLSNYETVTNTTRMLSRKQMNDFTFLRQAASRAIGTIPRPNTNITEIAATAPFGASIVEVEGTVEIARRGEMEWIQAKAGMLISVGDRLRTGNESRATLRFSDLSVVRVSQLTSMEIQAGTTNKLEKPSLRLDRGTLKFFNRGSNSISTPAARATIRD